MACKIFDWNREVGAWSLLKDCGRAEASPKHWEEQGDLGTHLLLLRILSEEVHSAMQVLTHKLGLLVGWRGGGRWVTSGKICSCSKSCHHVMETHQLLPLALRL